MNTTEIIQRLAGLESGISYDKEPEKGELPFKYNAGWLPILITAPHGTKHWRKGIYKEEEGCTSALAQFVAQETGAHALFATEKSNNDPNFDQKAPFKEHIKHLCKTNQIKFVLDIHGMSDKRNFGIAIGTINNQSCSQEEQAKIIKSLQANGFQQANEKTVKHFSGMEKYRFVVDHNQFTGGTHQDTVTKFVWQELDIGAAQLEITASLRIVKQCKDAAGPTSFRGDIEGIAITVKAISEMIQLLEENH